MLFVKHTARSRRVLRDEFDPVVWILESDSRLNANWPNRPLVLRQSKDNSAGYSAAWDLGPGLSTVGSTGTGNGVVEIDTLPRAGLVSFCDPKCAFDDAERVNADGLPARIRLDGPLGIASGVDRSDPAVSRDLVARFGDVMKAYW